MRICVFTIFPDMLECFFSGSLLGRARQQGVLEVEVCDLRSAAQDPRRSVDDTPFGGGAGMVMAPGPLFAAVEKTEPPRPLFLLSPGGRTLDQSFVEELGVCERIASVGIRDTHRGFSGGEMVGVARADAIPVALG